MTMATVIPQKNDILSGRGPAIAKHHGNQQFRSMVDAQRQTFAQIKRKGKQAIALKIMQDISSLEPPGRFLMESKDLVVSTNSESNNNSGVHPIILSKMWVIVDNKNAMKKVLHRLRDNKRDNKDPGGGDGIKPSAKNKVQKSSTLPDGSMSEKLSQNEGAEGAFAGRAQTKSSEDIVSRSSGRVHGNYTTSGHKNNSALLVSKDSPNKDATWGNTTGGEMDGNTTSPPIHDDQDKERIRSNILHGSHEECDWDAFFDQERDRRNSNCSIKSTSVGSIESLSMGSIESMISMDGTLRSESLDITPSLGLHNGDVMWEDATGKVLNGNTRSPIHYNDKDKNDFDNLFDEEFEGSEQHLDLQPEPTGPTSSSDTAVEIMQQGAHEGPNATERGSLDKEVGISLNEFRSQSNSTDFLHLPQSDTCVTTNAMSVREWMSKAIIADTRRVSSWNDGDSYLQVAVDLALALTKHLLDLLGTKFDLKIGEITSDNFMILVKPEPLALSHLVNQPRPEIVGVQFHFENVLPLTSVLEDPNNDAVANSPVDPHQTCTRLGYILLEIFSKGQSISTKVSHADLGNGSTNDNSTGTTQNGVNKSQGIFDLLARFQVEDEGDNGSTNNNFTDMRSTQNGINEFQDIDLLDGSEAEYEVAAKRMAAVSLTSDSLCDQAKRLLVDMGAPLSICRLVCDLLDAARDESPANSTRPITLCEAFMDLTQMKNNPKMFLFDRNSPQNALADTQLFDSTDGQLFGREEEIGKLMNIKNNISQHVRGDSQAVNDTSSGSSFLFEAAFLAGYAGSGKSRLMRSLINECEHDKWFVLKCKFDSKSVPLRIVAKAFDDFFGRWGLYSEKSSYEHDPSMLESFHQVSQAIFSAFDGDSFSQLCAMIPNMSRIFPRGSGSGSIQELSSNGAAGAAENRLVYLINALLHALCSASRPVLVVLDDLQWEDSFIIAGLSSIFSEIHTNGESSVRRGLMIAGTYRSNEVKEGGDLLETINLIKNSSKVNLTMLDVDGLSERDTTQLISAKLVLPCRYTLDLAKLVHHKTKGNPFFVIQFLKTIIRNKMLQFSVRQRMWTWDCGTIDLQMISEGVAALLTSTFDRLTSNLRRTLKIISLFGNQIEASTVEQMNSGQLVLSFDMKPELDLAVKEGLLEKAGPLYAFSHDLIHQTLYDSMPAGDRSLLHKVIGNKLLECSDDANHSMHLLAVDHINIYCKDGQLSHEERSKYAKANAVAAHYAMAGSSFEKARSYVDMGIKQLLPGRWEKQYSLSLDLYEGSASLCYMCGDTAKMSSCLDEILAHANTFEDSLNASAMLARLLVSSHKPNVAITNCLVILAKLGEEIPPEPDHTIFQNKLSEIQPLLLTLTADRMKALPTMADTSKLQAMKFLGMLCEISVMAAPMLLPLLSIRMMKLTLQFGFCSDSILGIFYSAFSVFLFGDNVPLAYQVGKIGVILREESQNKHTLRSRLLWVWEAFTKPMIEPLQAVTAEHPSLFKSAMLVGDVQNAMLCRHSQCVANLIAGEVLTAVSNHFALCIQQSTKYQQHVTLNVAMAWYRVVVQLSGQDATDVKSFNELIQIGKDSSNNFLVFNVIVSQMCAHFWFRDYTAIVTLCEEHPAPAAKRFLSTMRCFYEGVAALNLARQQPNEPKYKVIGEKAVKGMSKFEEMNKWTFENKFLLLQAELHYLNQDFEAAENAYIASIQSAKDHKFMNEEAMANELFGIFCIEKQMCDKGMKHLRIALDLYKQWGAMNKATDLEKFIDVKASVYALEWS